MEAKIWEFRVTRRIHLFRRQSFTKRTSSLVAYWRARREVLARAVRSRRPFDVLMQPVLDCFGLDLVQAQLAPARHDLLVQLKLLLHVRGLGDLVSAAEILLHTSW